MNDQATSYFVANNMETDQYEKARATDSNDRFGTEYYEQVVFRIQNDTERTFLVLWTVTVLLTSLIGDSIILLVTFKYHTIKLHKVVIAVMQHMAICDLLQTVFVVFPITLSLIFDRWMMGEVFCHIQDSFRWNGCMVTILLTCVLTTLKMIIVKHPLKTGGWSSRFGHRICGVVWLFYLGLETPQLYFIIYGRGTIAFSYIAYMCEYSYFNSRLPEWYTYYALITFIGVPAISVLTIIATSILLLVIAKGVAAQHGDSLRWKGISTVLLTVGVLLISQIGWWVMSSTIRGGGSQRILINLQFLNIMANFFIYSLTVPSFRLSLKLKISQIISAVIPTDKQRQRTLHGTDTRPACRPRQEATVQV